MTHHQIMVGSITIASVVVAADTSAAAVVVIVVYFHPIHRLAMPPYTSTFYTCKLKTAHPTDCGALSSYDPV